MRASAGRSSGSGAAMFFAGVAAALVASRILPPFLAQAAGLVQATGDPIDALVQDHRAILRLLRQMETSPTDAVFDRTHRLLRLKRLLTAHALAEESVVYPALHERAGDVQETHQLYREHADMKMYLFTLEQMAKDDAEWPRKVAELRALIEGHVRQEEEVEFPKLRAALDSHSQGQLSAKIRREKALIL